MTEKPNFPLDEASNKELTSLIAVSESMLMAAKIDDWKRVVEIEAQRRPCIDRFFNHLNLQELSGIVHDELRRSLERLIQLDQQITTLGLAAKGEIAGKLVEMNTKRQAVSAYQNNKSL